MSRVTEFPEDEPKPSAVESEEAGGRTLISVPRFSPLRRLSEFYNGVKQEMRKTTWPTRTEVWSTTVVVLIAVVFFGFYLWGVDRLVTLGFRYIESVVK